MHERVELLGEREGAALGVPHVAAVRVRHHPRLRGVGRGGVRAAFLSHRIYELNGFSKVNSSTNPYS